MPDCSLKIGFIGAGNMGQAMIGALITSGTANPADIIVCDILSDQTRALSSQYGVTVAPDNTAVINTCDVIIFAVKPQSLASVLLALKSGDVFRNLSGRKIFISIAAGITIQKLEADLYDGADQDQKNRMPILRVMPNTPALVLSAMSGLCANRFANANDLQIARNILSAMGKVIEFPESDMDAVTAVSGSGPAYCFYLAEAMIEAAERLGISPNHATEMTTQTLKGALRLLENQKSSPEELRCRVTSPGGTTEAAVRVFDHHGMRQIIINGIFAAAQRSRELSS
jgi:pyrroline-5-carboxylate reductase